MRGIVADAVRADDLRRLSGGASQETWAFSIVDRAGQSRRMVLRRAPPGSSGTGKLPLASEARLMQAAAQMGVPSPPVLLVLRPEQGLGDGFIMDHVDGETIARRIIRDDTYAAARRVMARQAGQVLARIHAMPIDEFADLPRATAADELDDLHETYRRDGQPRPVFELAFRWLRERMPASDDLKLVHGDFRNGNLIVGPDGIRAVLDWELACISHPARDLGWLCTPTWRFGAIDQPVGGVGRREDLLDGYVAAGGRAISMDDLLFWEGMGSLRWGVICLKMRAMAEGPDRPLERAMIARRTSETELDLMQMMAPIPTTRGG